MASIFLRISRRVRISNAAIRTAARNIASSSAVLSPDQGSVDKETHTGQKWDADDYRLVRYAEAPKQHRYRWWPQAETVSSNILIFLPTVVQQVNEQRAIDLIAEAPPKPCVDRVISCDGGGGPLGHPKVFINLDQPGNHSCGYCGLRFYLDNKH